MGSARPGSTKNIQRVREEIASWRRERYARAPLPEHLWADAVDVAQHVGVNRARVALGVSHGGLRAHVGRHAAGEKCDNTQFVELTGAEVLAAGLATTSGATIEISGRDGVRVVVRLGDSKALDVAALIDAVRGGA